MNHVPTIVLLAASLVASPALADASPAVSRGAMQVRLGTFFPVGGDDVWDANEQIYTLEASDFNDVALGVSMLYAIDRVVDFGVNLDFYEQTVVSEDRDFVDGAGFPIVHDTRLRVVPLTVDLRFVVGGRYRPAAAGRESQVKPTLYLGAGAGISYWEYEELGDFVDLGGGPPTLFSARFRSSGAALEAHLLAGFELPLGRSTSFLLEGRYSFSSDELGDDFDGVGTLALGGTSIYGGLSFRF